MEWITQSALVKRMRGYQGGVATGESKKHLVGVGGGGGTQERHHFLKGASRVPKEGCRRREQGRELQPQRIPRGAGWMEERPPPRSEL